MSYQGKSTKSQVIRARNQHFIYRDCETKTYYLYQGGHFGDPAGYELLLMAKHFPEQNEIRIYSTHDIKTEGPKSGMISDQNRFNKKNSMRVHKEQELPFDWENGHFAKVCINKRTNKTPEFVIKSRHCNRCSRKSKYYC